MSAADLSERLQEPVPSAPPQAEHLQDWCEKLWRACRAMAERQDELVATVQDLEARIADLEAEL